MIGGVGVVELEGDSGYLADIGPRLGAAFLEARSAAAAAGQHRLLHAALCDHGRGNRVGAGTNSRCDRSLVIPLTIFLSAFLLFQVQPMIGRYVLPWFGGGPAVWTNCMLFFQTMLLAGYGYAHWLGSRRSRVQSWVHLALLAASLAFLPIAPRAAIWKTTATGDPSGRILLLLAATIGGPYLLLSSTTPLVQRWFHLTRPQEAPWRLYALSNLGSFLALFSYPLVLEPYFRLSTQTWMWSGLYVVFVALCGWMAWQMRGVKAAEAGGGSRG